MIVKPYTQEEINEFLTRRLAGESNAKIARELGRSSDSFSQIWSKWLKFNKGITVAPNLTKMFTRYIKNEAITVIPEIPESQSETLGTKVDRMEKAFQVFLETLIDVAKEKSTEENKKALDDQKAEYEKKLIHYQELLAAAQDSNMLGFVKKRLGL